MCINFRHLARLQPFIESASITKKNKQVIKQFCILLLSLTYLCLSAFTNPPKPHLIVGNWQLVDSQRAMMLLSKQGKRFSVERIALSSDEITCGIALIEEGSKDEVSTTFGYRVLEPFDNFNTPVILFKDLCNNKTRMVFSILQLDKEYLKLKFEKEFSSEDVTIAEVILEFYRTAGPPENMP